MLAVVLIVIVLMRFNLTALQSAGEFLRSPPHADDSAGTGRAQYGLDCSMCHGVDGRAQMPTGRWMYPRAADLTGKQVQSYSDQELFWIIQNGIRYTGMPAFGEVESSDHIWDLVNHVRTLAGEVRTGDSRGVSDSLKREREDAATKHRLARR